jgi:hypothetical protein
MIERDANDGKEWSEMDVEDLIASADYGSTLEATAEYLCRSGTADEVAAKAKELGVTFGARSVEPAGD